MTWGSSIWFSLNPNFLIFLTKWYPESVGLGSSPVGKETSTSARKSSHELDPASKSASAAIEATADCRSDEIIESLKNTNDSRSASATGLSTSSKLLIQPAGSISIG